MLTQVTEHQEQAQAKLLEQFKGSVSLSALLASFIEQIQDVENAAFAVLQSRFIDDATGAQLDLLGKLLGQPRNGQDDDTYRIYIKVRIQLNTGSGTPNNVLDVFRALSGDNLLTDLSLVEAEIASFELHAYEVPDGTEVTYNAILQSARAAGIRALFFYTTLDSSTVFQCDTGGGHQLDNGTMVGVLG